ncbi:MAG: hypothetical protein FD123_490 [Bacteroidetes bacterium]|nr:MAG: hypothetical protein FD123_490 [Bacteroidota bacterium]
MKRNKKKLKEKIYRVVAVYLALNLLAEIIVPTAAYALTGGPSQAEFESFEPAGTTEMVNPFTGDFNYNIPLMTVPGPNGGYPINLAYHAGVGMEQEASWVGLGWNINAGEITRGMRGLPDDFKGDEVQKTLSMRPNWNLSAKYTYSAQQMNEIFGLSFRRASPNHTGILYWDSYRGVGVSYSLGLASSSNSLNTSHMSKSLTLSFGSDEGIGVVPNLSYNDQKNSKDKKYLGLSASAGINSRQGVYGLSLGASRVVEKTGFNPRQTLGVSFARNSYVPNSEPEMIGGNVNLGIEVGEVTTTESFIPFFTTPIPASSEKVLTQGFSASYSNRHYKNTTNKYNAYGYFYEDESDNSSSNTSLKDFNREKDVAVNRHSPALPLAVSTYDSYSIKGQGIGGAFRPFRSDIGLYTDPTTESVINGGELVVELGKNSTADKYHIGFDAGFNHSRSYSGQWENTNHWQEIAGLKHLGKSDVSDALYEPAYFKTTGEMTASPTAEMLQLQGDQAVRFKLNTVFEDGPLGNVSINPRIANDELILGAYATQSNYYPMSSYANRTSRQKRVQSISHRTHEQIADYNNYSSRPEHLYLDGKYPGAAPSGGDNYAYDYTANPDAHIGEISVVNPDGNRYFYGIPAYNATQSDAVFSIDGLDYDNGLTLGDFPATQAYSTNDLDPAQNDNGYDHFISKTTLPKYAHSYLLTAIVSPDYVDVDGNGPSENDLGYYVKFNYYKQSSTYNWRFPYCGANYMKNDISNELDDKASYSYGQKELYYLNSIETKTHVARFILNNAATEIRQDGYGASSENATSLTPTVSSGQAQRYLKEIKLYSKNDYTKVLKTVALVYDYSLCSGTLPNNYGASAYDPHEPATEINVAKGKGKLTLKKLYITYLGSDKGSLVMFKMSLLSSTKQKYLPNDLKINTKPDVRLKGKTR